MFVLKLGQVIDVLVDNHPQAVRLAMRGDVVLGESLGHGDDAVYGDLRVEHTNNAETPGPRGRIDITEKQGVDSSSSLGGLSRHETDSHM